jgi:alpha/beta superfamily hydrolase
LDFWFENKPSGNPACDWHRKKSLSGRSIRLRNYTFGATVTFDRFFFAWGQCYDIRKTIFFTPKNGELKISNQTVDIQAEKSIHNIGYQEKRHFFERRLAKIAEMSDHNTESWSTTFRLPNKRYI